MPARLASLVWNGTGVPRSPGGTVRRFLFSEPGRAVADTFNYLSPRQVQQLADEERNRYLAALYAHLHITPREKRIEISPQPQDESRKPS